MNARELIERHKPKKPVVSPHAKDYRGPFADFSAGRNNPTFYVTCPGCKDVHGNFKTFDDAVNGRVCTRCNFEDAEKLKKEVSTVDDPPKPKKFKRPMSTSLRENDDIKHAIMQLPHPNSVEVKVTLTFNEPIKNRRAVADNVAHALYLEAMNNGQISPEEEEAYTTHVCAEVDGYKAEKEIGL